MVILEFPKKGNFSPNFEPFLFVNLNGSTRSSRCTYVWNFIFDVSNAVQLYTPTRRISAKCEGMTHFVLPKSSAHALFLQPMRSEYGPDVSYGFSLPDSSYFSLFLPHFFPTNSKDSKKNRKNILCSSEKLIFFF